MYTVRLPVRRSFTWRVLFILVALYFGGNLAGVPLLRRTNMPIEPVWFWVLATFISALVIALSLLLAHRTGLGAPLLEGIIPRTDRPGWWRTGLLLTLLMIVVCSPFSLLANQGIDPATYPFGWELLGASFKAGVTEEIISRLFLVSLFVWLGAFIKRDADGRPGRGLYWAAIILAGLLFGYGHVDAQLGNPAASTGDYVLLMVLASGLGIYFGWMYWKLGLEWAMLAHFAYDAFVSMVLVPVYLLANTLAWLGLIAGLSLAIVICLRGLWPAGKARNPQA